MNLKNSHIISTYHVSNKDSTTTLSHTILHPVRSTKRKRHSRTTITLFQPTTQLPVTRSLLHQQTYLIMTTILFLPPTRATYHFIVYTLHNSLQSSSNAFWRDYVSRSHTSQTTLANAVNQHATDLPPTHISPQRPNLGAFTAYSLTYPTPPKEERLG